MLVSEVSNMEENAVKRSRLQYEFEIEYHEPLIGIMI